MSNNIPPTNGYANGSSGHFPKDTSAAAALYTSIGLSTVPAPTRSKNPGALHDGWSSLRLTAADLDRYFPRDVALNVAVLNGEPSSRIHDVDADCPEAIITARRLLPPTGWVFGRKTALQSHRIYKTDRSLDSAKLEFCDTDGKGLVELRGTGGITIYPPSCHKETGEVIAWHQFERPGEVLLGDLQNAVAAVAAAAILARHWPAKGSRDRAAMALAGGLVRAGWSEEKVSDFVQAVAEAAGDEEARARGGKAGPAARKHEAGTHTTGWPTLAGLLTGDGEAVVRSVRGWLNIAKDRPEAPTKPARPAKPPRLIPPYVPFPTDALPSPLKEFVLQGAASFNCDPVFLALPVLSVVASTIGNTRVIALKRGWTEACVLWTCVVADSGTVKTPTWRRAVAHLLHTQRLALQEHREEMTRYEAELEAHQAAKKKAGGGGASAPPEKPVARRVICSDTTVEKLAVVLEGNPRGALLARDELNGWLTSFDRYKGRQGGSDLPLWLEAHQAGSWLIDRKTGDRPTLFIPRAAISVAGGIQPRVLARAFTTDFLDSGGAARMLLGMPPKAPKVWTEAEIDPDTERAYHALLDQLLSLPFGTDASEEASPVILKLSAEAKARWVQFYNSWAQEQAAVEGELAAAYSKLEAAAARLALLHHVVTCASLEVDDRREVGLRSVEAGIQLCLWFAHEARRVYATLTESNEERDARRLVEFIRGRGGRITVKDLQQSNSRKYPKAAAAEAALEALVAAGLGRWEDRKIGASGGRPTRHFILSTSGDDTDETSHDGDGGDDGGGPTPSDETSPTPNETPGNPEGNEVSSVSSRVMHDTGGVYGADPPAMSAPGVSSGDSGVSSDSPEGGPVGRAARRPTQDFALRGAPDDTDDTDETSDTPLASMAPDDTDETPDRERGGPSGVGSADSPAYLLVDTPAGLAAVAAALDNTAVIGLDLETTGLDPRADRVRLLCLTTDTIYGGTLTNLIDCQAVDPSPLWEVLATKELAIHNASFDLGFLAQLGFIPGVVHDTLLMARALAAGGPDFHHCTLKDCARRELGIDLDKTHQAGGWSGALTPEMLAYAALDALTHRRLYEALLPKVRQAGLQQAIRIEEKALPAFVWMAAAGAPFDTAAWRSLAEEARQEADDLSRRLDDAAPPRPGMLLKEGAFSWDSPQQVSEAFRLLGHDLTSTDDETLAGIDHPLASLLRQYRAAMKRVGTYGTDWLKHVADDGRIYPDWNQLGSVAGRTSCSNPNLQQVPRDKRYRRCFAAPEGRVLVKCDYSQLQLRIAAKVADEKRMLEAYARGEDLHTLTARQITGKEEVDKADRQIAKAVNFGLLFGLGAKGLRGYAKGTYGLDLTEEEAAQYRLAFFKAYPGLATWHRRAGSSRARECRTLIGRRRLLDDKTPFTFRLNSPVQGSEADGAKLAMGLLWDRRDQAPGAFPVLFCHDEIVVECDAGQADAVKELLRSAMCEAMAPMIAPVPVEVEATVGRTWAGD